MRRSTKRPSETDMLACLSYEIIETLKLRYEQRGSHSPKNTSISNFRTLEHIEYTMFVISHLFPR